MTNVSDRLCLQVFAFALLGSIVGCTDSGHSLGESRPRDAGVSDGAQPPEGATGTGGDKVLGSTLLGGSTGGGGATTGAGGQGGTSAASDAGPLGGSDAGGTCAYRGESCASRPCCGPLVCLTLSSPPSCYESYPPQVDGASVVVDAFASGDTSGACPSAPPTNGSACVGQASCFYDVCPSTSRTQATCTGGKWSVETGECGQVSCLGDYAEGNTCSSGEVCLVQIGGMLVITCMADACGAGPASPDCTTFTTGCTPMFDLSSGVTYYCNTCPTGTCA